MITYQYFTDPGVLWRMSREPFGELFRRFPGVSLPNPAPDCESFHVALPQTLENTWFPLPEEFTSVLLEIEKLAAGYGVVEEDAAGYRPERTRRLEKAMRQWLSEHATGPGASEGSRNGNGEGNGEAKVAAGEEPAEAASDLDEATAQLHYSSLAAEKSERN
jgi:hypothetical protein